jgi:hypothetical protein
MAHYTARTNTPIKSNTFNGIRKIEKNRRMQLIEQHGEFSPGILLADFYTYVLTQLP